MSQGPTLKIDSKMLKGPLTVTTTGLSGLSISSSINNPSWSGIRINPEALMKMEPFNNLSRQVETLTAVVQVLAVKLGMTQDEIDKMMADAMRGVRVAEELMEK
jgi:hypothetical protein